MQNALEFSQIFLNLLVVVLTAVLKPRGSYKLLFQSLLKICALLRRLYKSHSHAALRNKLNTIARRFWEI
jgi:hypothetical protein